MLAVFLERGEVRVRQAPEPCRLPGYALLRLIAAGICNTDLELQRGYYGFQGIPGHEFVALVEECDDPRLIGRRVVGEINLACGNCDFCAVDMGRHCRQRTVLGIIGHPGAFAELLTLPVGNLRIVPDNVTDFEAVFTEPLAAACEIFDQVTFDPAQEVAVIGDGKLGLLVAQALLARGLPAIVFGRHEAKLRLAHSAGAQVSFAHQLPSARYGCVVECSGSADGVKAAIQITRPRGTVVLKSTIHNPVSFDLAPAIVNELSLVGSRCGRFEPALALLSAKRVQVSPMITAVFPLAEAQAAFELASTRGTLKVLLHNA